MGTESSENIVSEWRRAAEQYPAEIDAARKAGLHLSLKELKKPLPSENDNAATFYKKLGKVSGESDSEKRLYDFLSGNPSPDQIKHAQQALTKSTALLDLVHQVTGRTQCVFDRFWDTPHGETAPMLELITMRNAARLLLAESLLLSDQGKGQEAVHNLTSGFRIVQHALSDSLLMAWLVARAIDSILLSGMEKILLRSSGEPTVAHAVREALTLHRKSPRLAPVMAVETAFHHTEIGKARQEGFYPYLIRGFEEMSTAFGEESKAEMAHYEHEMRAELDRTLRPETRALIPAHKKLLLDASAAFVLRWMCRLKAVADLPYTESAPVFATFTRDLETPPAMPDSQKAIRMIPASLMATLAPAIQAKAMATVQASILFAGATLLEQRAKSGADIPETIRGLPKDPFSGGPLGYRKEGKGSAAGFILYSVGPDGNFNGGQNRTPISRLQRPLLFRYTTAPERTNG